MLNTILRLNTTGSEKPIVAWTRMLSYIKNRTDMYTESVINGPVCMPPWTNKIAKLLNAVNVEDLLQLPATQRYASILMDANTRLNWILAPNYSVPSLKNQFTASNNNVTVQEYIIPCRSEFPLMKLPLGKDISYWSNVNPINMIYNDSTELCSYILRMQYLYKKSSPSLVIVTVDIPSLVLKYCAYADSMKKEGKQYTIFTFMRDQLLNNFYTDCVRCWLFTMMKNYFTQEEMEPTSSLIVDNSAVKEANEDLQDFLKKVKGKHYFSNDFIHTKWLPSNDGPISILTYMNWLKENVVFPEFNQAKYLSFFTQYHLVYLLIKLYNLGDRPNDRIIERELYIKLYRLNRTHILQMCNNKKLKIRINKDIRDLLDLCRPNDFSPTLD